MATVETAWKKGDGPVRYHGGERTVEPGDRVSVRCLFWRRPGAINYVPGISPVHEEMEHGALHWVGIALDRGTFTGVLVDPDSGCTLKQLEFVARGDAADAAPIPPAPFE